MILSQEKQPSELIFLRRKEELRNPWTDTWQINHSETPTETGHISSRRFLPREFFCSCWFVTEWEGTNEQLYLTFISDYRGSSQRRGNSKREGENPRSFHGWTVDRGSYFPVPHDVDPHTVAFFHCAETLLNQAGMHRCFDMTRANLILSWNFFVRRLPTS